MGFSLNFMRVSPDALVDADRAGIAEWLASKSLEIAPSNDRVHHLAGPDGGLQFEGSWTDLHLDPLDQEGPVTGGIWHATLSDEECAFIYDLCVAGQMLIVNPQGAPLFVVPGGTHEPSDLPPNEEGNTAWVGSGAELSQALSGGFADFLEFRARVTGD